MRISRDLIVVVLLFAVLIGFTVYSAVRRAEQEQETGALAPYSTRSALPNGTLALQKWLEAIGYQGRRIEGNDFSLPAEARVLFVFPTQHGFTEDEAQPVLRWVERGNTLVVAQAGRFGDDDRLARGLKVRALPASYVLTSTLEQPLNGVGLNSAIRTQSTWALDLSRDDYVEYLSNAGRPLLVSWVQGRGKVFVTSAPFLFTNEGLHEQAGAALVLALLNDIPRGSIAALDEFHVTSPTRQGGCAESLQSLVYCSPWGWAIIFGIVVVFAWLAVNGQRFGRVMPLPQDIARRSPAEYVYSTAQLFRRAGKRHMALDHYHRELKRSLGRPFRINADLPDEEFINELARFREIDRAELSRVLRALSRSDTSERALVKLADEAIQLRRRSV
jgi:uncharacterized protein DUF4350